ncbi:MAG TPA: glycosyltransferase family 39 protein [Solirubrobacteraceae bacterium]|nr:glycosyltransferase family 39 protein [Solirubrobacteraceae bacterium]
MPFSTLLADVRTSGLPSALRLRRGPAGTPPDLRARLQGMLLTPPAAAGLVCAVFLAISAWWLANDVRMVNVDNAKHLLIALRWKDALAGGDLLEPFTGWALYPPGVHLVGAITMLVSGLSVPAVVMVENLVFVPLLALGCYGTAKIAFGRTAGLLAVLFAFAVPMVMSMFHVFMLDAPEAAMVAVTAWLLLASERFSRVGVAAAAGIVAGLGMYAKGTFALFIAGLALMLFLRGGWRNWKGWLACGVLFAVICAPWYIGHLDDLRGQTSGAIGTAASDPSTPLWYDRVHFPETWTFANFAWYGWNLVNHQLYLPLTLFFLAGLGWSLREVALRRRWKDSYLPELLAGGMVGYVGVSMIVLKDPRYSLPCLVFIAAIATGWITTVSRPGRTALMAVLAAVFVVNTLNHNFGVGGIHAITTSATVPSPIREYSATVLNEAGYFEGGPSRSAQPFVDLLHRIEARGGRAVAMDLAAFSSGGWHPGGTTLLVAGHTELPLTFGPEAVRTRSDYWITRLSIEDVGRPPCIPSPFADDETGLYVYRGRVPRNPARTTPDCP